MSQQASFPTTTTRTTTTRSLPISSMRSRKLQQRKEDSLRAHARTLQALQSLQLLHKVLVGLSSNTDHPSDHTDITPNNTILSTCAAVLESSLTTIDHSTAQLAKLEQLSVGRAVAHRALDYSMQQQTHEQTQEHPNSKNDPLTHLHEWYTHYQRQTQLHKRARDRQNKLQKDQQPTDQRQQSVTKLCLAAEFERSTITEAAAEHDHQQRSNNKEELDESMEGNEEPRRQVPQNKRLIDKELFGHLKTKQKKQKQQQQRRGGAVPDAPSTHCTTSRPPRTTTSILQKLHPTQLQSLQLADSRIPRSGPYLHRQQAVHTLSLLSKKDRQIRIDYWLATHQVPITRKSLVELVRQYNHHKCPSLGASWGTGRPSLFTTHEVLAVAQQIYQQQAPQPVSKQDLGEALAWRQYSKEQQQQQRSTNEEEMNSSASSAPRPTPIHRATLDRYWNILATVDRGEDACPLALH